MARIHGRGSLLYLQGAGAQAVPFSNAADYSLDTTFSPADVTAIGEDWTSAVRGPLGFAGTINGPLDTASTTAWDALTSTAPRNFYLYPDKTNMATYYYGTAWVDLSVKGGAAAAVTFTSKITGTGQLARQ